MATLMMVMMTAVCMLLLFSPIIANLGVNCGMRLAVISTGNGIFAYVIELRTLL